MLNHPKPHTYPSSHHYPFGMMMADRQWTSESGYRFGFNGKEIGNETYGDGNIYDYGFRIYNPRIGKFLSVDPLAKTYPSFSPYHFSGNNPIRYIDLDGLEQLPPLLPGESSESYGGEIVNYDNNVWYFIPDENSGYGGYIGVYTEREGWYFFSPDIYEVEPIIIVPEITYVTYNIDDNSIKRKKHLYTMVEKASIALSYATFNISVQGNTFINYTYDAGNTATTALSVYSEPFNILPFDFEDAVGGSDMIAYGYFRNAQQVEGLLDYNNYIVEANKYLSNSGNNLIQVLILTQEQYYLATTGQLDISEINTNQIIDPIDLENALIDFSLISRIIYFRNAGDNADVQTGNLREYEIE